MGKLTADRLDEIRRLYADHVTKELIQHIDALEADKVPSVPAGIVAIVDGWRDWCQGRRRDGVTEIYLHQLELLIRNLQAAIDAAQSSSNP